jgi:hypothetical protein
MRYTVIFDNSRQGLINQVAQFLAQGWALQGGVSVCALDDAEYPRGTLEYSQAMVLNPAS